MLLAILLKGLYHCQVLSDTARDNLEALVRNASTCLSQHERTVPRKQRCVSVATCSPTPKHPQCVMSHITSCSGRGCCSHLKLPVFPVSIVIPVKQNSGRLVTWDQMCSLKIHAEFLQLQWIRDALVWLYKNLISLFFTPESSGGYEAYKITTYNWE